jgi:hypothetical protein
MPQMMLIARNSIHPRELTYLLYETGTKEIPGWRRRLILARETAVVATKFE